MEWESCYSAVVLKLAYFSQFFRDLPFMRKRITTCMFAWFSKVHWYKKYYHLVDVIKYNEVSFQAHVISKPKSNLFFLMASSYIFINKKEKTTNKRQRSSCQKMIKWYIILYSHFFYLCLVLDFDLSQLWSDDLQGCKMTEILQMYLCTLLEHIRRIILKNLLTDTAIVIVIVNSCLLNN